MSEAPVPIGLNLLIKPDNITPANTRRCHYRNIIAVYQICLVLEFAQVIIIHFGTIS